jgi:hypothetical protein
VDNGWNAVYIHLVSMGWVRGGDDRIYVHRRPTFT